LCFPLSFLCDLTKIDDDLCCCQTWMVALNRTECTYGTSAIHAHTRIVRSSDVNDILIND